MLPKEHTVTVINARRLFPVRAVQPVVAVGWRKREEIVLQIAPLLERKGIDFIAKPVTRSTPPAARWRWRAATRLPTTIW